MRSIADPKFKFGTSGLRGPAESFTPEWIAAYVTAFLDVVGEEPYEKTVYIGADLRDSSPQITASIIAAVSAGGWHPVYAGNVPTPALAFYALERNCLAIMVTGSHIPETHNGIKFYRRDGELLKDDEEPIRKRAYQLVNIIDAPIPQSLPEPDEKIARAYVRRYTSTISATSLTGMKIGVDLHSAVGRDLLVEILESLGAKCFPFRRSEKFIAVDTEALNKEDIIRAKNMISKHDLDCVVSTDGDGDRPLLIDKDGNQINGDVLGALTAHALKLDTIVTPLSSTSAIEKSEWFGKVNRTKIGSPFVVAAMKSEAISDSKIAGFEANGGFLLGTDLKLDIGTLSALPTRDAVLPIIVTLGNANRRHLSLSALAKKLPARFMQADRIQQISQEKAEGFLRKLQASSSFRSQIHPKTSDPISIDTTDGLRIETHDSSIIHFRQSGNAPEFRIYVETGNQYETETLLAQIKKSSTLSLTDQDQLQ